MRRNNASRGRGGPLMTEHIQLQDLDLELELLKRKREIIEQQQQMLTNNQVFNRPSPFDYGNNKPRPLFPEHQPFSNNSNFSRYYNEPQQPLGFGGGGLLGKRPSNNPPVWQSDSAPKRFSGPQSGQKKRFGAGPAPKPNNQPTRHQGSNSGPFSQNKPRQQWDNKPKPFGAPKSTFPSQRFNNTPKGSKPQQRDFKPNKVTKPKPPQQGNKLASYPTPERKKLVQQSTKSSKADDDFTGDEFILRSDTVPSQQMAGRLELALGNILKDIKTKFGNTEPNVASFQSPFLTRRMKQAIRERLRAVMLGKHVGKVTAIVDHYRKVFPTDTDSEILDIALAEQQNSNKKHLAIKLESADNAFKYLKLNMNKLIAVSLDDMFEKLQKIYEDGKQNSIDVCEAIIAAAEHIDFTKDVEPDNDDKNDSVEQSSEKADENKVENGDNKDNGEAMETTEEKPSEVVEDKPEDTKATDGEKPSGDGEVTKEESASDEKPSKKDTPSKNDEKAPISQKSNAKKIDELILNLIKRRLPYILPKFKHQLMKLLNAAGTYRVTKTAILDKTQERLDLQNRVEKAQKNLNTTVDLSQSESTATAATSTPKKNQSDRFAYMVKIIGRPALPKRKIMQEFLEEFKPTSVKKHRHMHLLFVTFADRDSFEKIVAVKETEMGNCAIIITATEKSVAKQNESVNNTALDDSTEKIIGADLDEQINDLLSSIRQEEEGADNDVEINLDEPHKDVDMVTAADDTEEATEAVSTEDNEVAAANGTDEANEENEVAAANGTDAANEVAGDTEAQPEEIGENENEAIGNDEDAKVENEEAKDKVEELKADAKDSGRATPTRASTRLASVTPSSVRTRRASRLAQN